MHDTFSSLVILDEKDRKDSVLQTCWTVFSSCSLRPPLRLVPHPTGERTDTRPASAKTKYLATMARYKILSQRCILVGLQGLVHYLLANKKRWENVGTTLYFGCENVVI